jgi:hypothetical protein
LTQAALLDRGGARAQKRGRLLQIETYQLWLRDVGHVDSNIDRAKSAYASEAPAVSCRTQSFDFTSSFITARGEAK